MTLNGWICAVSALLALAAPSFAIAESARSSDVAAFLETVDRLRRDAAIPGLSVAVLERQQILLAAGLGLADLEAGTPATADTPYDIASVTKPLSAVVLMRLVEAGVIDLDRPIAEYSDWTDFCTGFSQQQSIFAATLECEPPTHTLRHLFSHTVGGTPGTRFSYNPVIFSWASRPILLFSCL